MGKKKSKDKKSHKRKHKHSRKDSSHIEHNEQIRNEQPRSEQPRTRLRLSYRRDDSSEVTNSSNVVANNDDIEMRNVNEENQDNGQIDVDNATVSMSRSEEPPRRTILKLKFNPDPRAKKSKKRKHKHRHREATETSSSHSHEKVDKGKRKMRDSVVESIHEEYNVGLDSTHPRKKIKRQKNSDANITINESANKKMLNKQSNDMVVKTTDKVDVSLSSDIMTSQSRKKLKEVKDNENFDKEDVEEVVYIAVSNESNEKSLAQDPAGQEQKSGEGTNKPKEAAGKKPLENIETGTSISMQDRKESSVVTSNYQLREKRSYPPSLKDSNKLDDSRPSKVHKISSKSVQSVQESSAIISSSKNSETYMPIQQTKVDAIKDSDSIENLNGMSIVKDVVVYSTPPPTKSGHVRKLGRPPKSQETQRINTQRSWTWQKKKKDLKTILNKLLDSFEKKDAYGFFLEPVDTSVVTDYSTIIMNPMDLGTMRRKVFNSEYTSIDAFKDDLALICNNCKTYNSPETLYYKSAEKLWAFGEKAIERERDSILLEEEKTKALKGIINIEDGIAMGKKAAINFGSSVSRPIRQPRRTRRGDPRKQFAPDGSVLPFGNPDVLLPKTRPFGETPLLTVISSKAQRPARFEDYGPFATLGVEAPYYSPSEKEYFYNIYGDERGYAYSQSIKNFVKDMGDEMNEQVDNFLNKLTRGAHNIDQCVAKMVSEVGSVDTFTILDTELGPVDVRQEFNRIQLLPELRRQRDELEMWQNEKIDLDSLESNNNEANPTLTVLENASFQEMLDLNAKSLAELISANENAVDLQGSQEQKQLVNDVQHRLFQLAQHAPKCEIKSGSTPPVQSYAMPVPMAGLQATKTLLPKHTISSAEQNDPISALAPSLPEFSATSSKSRTKPCNYNPAGKCANCQTTDTPGWRAGETPDQKLCNACGLYYAKNKSHRPPNLWATSSR